MNRNNSYFRLFFLHSFLSLVLLAPLSFCVADDGEGDIDIEALLAGDSGLPSSSVATQKDEYAPSDIDVIDTMSMPKRNVCSAEHSQEEAQGCVAVLTDLVNVLPLLKEPLYLRTHPLVTRNVLDLPLFSLYHLNRERAGLKFDIFYNQTSEMRFEKDSTDLASYIALQEPNTLRAIQNLESEICALLEVDEEAKKCNISIPPILQLVSRMKVTERRAGLMMTAIVPYEDLLAEVKLPLIYLQRNFDLSDAEIAALNRLNLPGGPISKSDPTTDFTRRYLLADRIGLGDLRLTLMAKVLDRSAIQYFLGAEVTVPTHVAFKQGLLSYAYEKVTCDPDLDICTLIELAKNDADQATTCATDFLLGGLRQLSSNLLDEADHRPVGLAAVLKSEWAFTDWALLRTRTIVEYLTPYRARRYYVTKRNSRAFVGRDFEDETKAIDNLNLINTKLTQKLYPYVIETIVRPGVQFKNTTSVNFMHGNWTASVGADTWWRQAEKFDICCGGSRFANTLDTAKGFIDEVYQTKVFGGITYKKHTKNHEIDFSLAGEGSLVSESVGDDFALLFGAELYF